MTKFEPFAKKLPFIKKTTSHGPHEPALWFMFQGEKIAVYPGDQSPSIPLLSPADLPFKPILPHCYIGTYGKTDCFGLELPENSPLPSTIQFFTLRSLLHLLEEDLFAIAGRAKQLVFFHKTHKYCGECGNLTMKSKTEDARTCPTCSHTFYPRLSPVVIMTVTKGSKLLLARSPHFPKGMYSCPAGFIEPGETAEEAVIRELLEETQIMVKNIKYITSQPWPFPHSLMFGFSSDYHGGNLLIDNNEIEDAAWFSTNSLPPLPSPKSIAGYLINRVLNNKM